MSDITKCSGKDCPMKDKCYRFTAKDGFWQSYFTKVPNKGKKCNQFWDNTK